MNLEAINKWLNEEYGCSYTRLEELHDFYFEKYSNLQQENKLLKNNWNALKEYIMSTRYQYGDLDQDLEDYDLTIEDVLDKMQELENGEDNNGRKII